MKAIKVIGKILLWTLAVVVVLLLALPLWIGPVVKGVANTVAPRITGTDFHLGEFGLNPYTGTLHVGDMQLANPTNFSDKNAVDLKAFDVDFAMTSLLFGKKYRVEFVEVNGVFVHIDVPKADNFLKIAENATGGKKDTQAEAQEVEQPKVEPEAPKADEAAEPEQTEEKPSKGVQIDRIEPEFWYAGMKQAQLQLMVYGPGIGQAEVALGEYAGVSLEEVVRLESENYLLVYLRVDPAAQPGTLHLTFARQGKRQAIPYELRRRDKAGAERVGFDSGDVLYMLMPDRFASGRNQSEPLPGLQPYTVDRTKPGARHGGDLMGIRQHLDYLTDLGVTALWLTPVLENNNRNGSYHGYATTNYYRVDPRFGSNEEYRELVAECHRRGLKLVMDMIFNHSGSEHPWNRERPSSDWYNVPRDGSYLQTSYRLPPVVDPYASQADLNETVNGWFVRSMPDLNQRNPHVLRYLIQNSKWWIEYAGIDGIRMDTYPYADRQAMADWMKELLEEYPHFNVVGEAWVNEPAFTAAWQQGSPLSPVDSHLPTVMDFSFHERINRAAAEDTDAGSRGLGRLYDNFCYDYLYPDPLHVMAFIENHDTDRFLRNGQNVPMLKQALTLLLTTRRIPQLYYGTEVLLNGTKERTDGYVRKDFPGGWPADTLNAFTPEGRTPAQQDMHQWLRTVLRWRRQCPAVTRGGMTHFCPVHGCYVFARTEGEQTVLVILNGTDKPQRLPMSRYAEIIGQRQQATDLTSRRTVPLQGELELQPRESLILEL